MNFKSLGTQQLTKADLKRLQKEDGDTRIHVLEFEDDKSTKSAAKVKIESSELKRYCKQIVIEADLIRSQLQQNPKISNLKEHIQKEVGVKLPVIVNKMKETNPHLLAFLCGNVWTSEHEDVMDYMLYMKECVEQNLISQTEADSRIEEIGPILRRLFA